MEIVPLDPQLEYVCIHCTKRCHCENQCAQNLQTLQMTQATSFPKAKPKIIINISCDHLAPNMAIILSIHVLHLLTHSQLLEGLKCESKEKTTEKKIIGARSLAHSTLRGRAACQSFGMGLGRVDKLQLFTWTYIKPTRSGQCIVGAPLVLK